MDHLGYYVFCIVAAMVCFLILKKITGCILKMIITFIVAAVIAAVYFMYIK